MRLALYSPDVPDVPGGVADHTLVLARALAGRGADVVVLARRGDPARLAPVPCEVGVSPLGVGGRGLAEAVAAHGASWLLVQYVPFLFARRGVAPALVAGLLGAKRAGARIAVFVHEPFVPFTRVPWLVTGGFQRAQLFAIARLADAIYTAVPAWVALLRRWAAERTAVRLAPVGASLPESSLSRAGARNVLALGDRDVAVGVFGASASGFLADWIVAANAALTGVAGVRWFLLGRGASALHARLPPAGVTSLGDSSATSVADSMAAMDLALAPYVDGLTMRRTSAMLALAHGVATVSSTGPLFDPALVRAAHCAPTRDAFAAAAAALVSDRPAREALAAAGLGHYAREASVDVLAARIHVDLLGGAT